MAFSCYHGTSKPEANIIVKEGFKMSEGDSHWLGDGIYTFVKGLSDPKDSAIKWTELRAWDNSRKAQVYQYGAVLEVLLDGSDDDTLNLNTKEGVDILNYIKAKCESKLKEIGRKLNYVDGYLINFGRNEIGLPIPVIIGNVYIKLDRIDRMSHISMHTPNCTVCCIYDQDYIKNIKIIHDWRIAL